MSVTTAGIRLTTTVGGEIRRTPPVTVTTATRFVNCSACGQKRIGREACGASPIGKLSKLENARRGFQPAAFTAITKRPLAEGRSRLSFKAYSNHLVGYSRVRD